MLLSDGGLEARQPPDEARDSHCQYVRVSFGGRDESLSTLRDLARKKRPGQILIVAGCMAQRAGERIAREVAGVDGLLGTRRWMEIVPFVEALRGGHGERRFGRYALLGELEQPLTGATLRPPVTTGSAYLKISDG